MHHHSAALLTALTLFLGCSTQSDDEGVGSEVGDTTAGETETETSTTGEASCEDAIAALTVFIEANSSCEIDEDCVGLVSFCYPFTSCGEVALTATYDMSVWSALEGELEAACGADECSADPCGATIRCVSSICVASL